VYRLPRKFEQSSETKVHPAASASSTVLGWSVNAPNGLSANLVFTQSVNPVENLQEDLEQSTFERDLEPTMPELEANEFHNGRGACQTLEATWPIGRSGTGLTAAVAAAACLGEAFESSAAALASTTALEQLSRLMQAIAIPHVYGFMPSWSSRGRLSALITAYGLEERAVSADGNCQFASASDQLFGTPALHASVREAVVRQLRLIPIAIVHSSLASLSPTTPQRWPGIMCGATT